MCIRDRGLLAVLDDLISQTIQRNGVSVVVIGVLDQLKCGSSGLVIGQDERAVGQHGVGAVSYTHLNIDFEKAKKAGVEFVIIRIGYRGYGSGTLVLDPRCV